MRKFSACAWSPGDAAACARLLHLERPIGGEAVVHGAYGVNPKTRIYEAVTNYPPLAFYNFKIEP